MADNDELKGKAKKIKGKIREGAGKLTGDESQELEGKIEQGKAKFRKKLVK